MNLNLSFPIAVKIFPAVFFFVLPVVALSQSTVVKDLNPGYTPYNSNPENITPFKDKLLMRASVLDYGSELVSFDTTDLSLSMVKNISFCCSSYPENFTILGNVALFVASDTEHGEELWITDGTADGTVLLVDIYPGEEDANILWLKAVDGKIYFSAKDNLFGQELWISDGTAAGTIGDP